MTVEETAGQIEEKDERDDASAESQHHYEELVDASRLKGGANSMLFLSLFLGLFLLLLAIFIMLNSISAYEVEKTRQVVESIDRAFVLPGSDPVNSPVITLESVEVDRKVETFIKDIDSALSKVLTVEKITHSPEGDRLFMEIKTRNMFRNGGGDLHPNIEQVLERTADSLVANDPLLRFEASMILGRGRAGAGSQVDTGLLLERADNFARFMRRAGVPASSVRIGLDESSPDMVLVIFEARVRERARVTFEEVVP